MSEDLNDQLDKAYNLLKDSYTSLESILKPNLPEKNQLILASYLTFAVSQVGVFINLMKNKGSESKILFENNSKASSTFANLITFLKDKKFEELTAYNNESFSIYEYYLDLKTEPGKRMNQTEIVKEHYLNKSSYNTKNYHNEIYERNRRRNYEMSNKNYHYYEKKQKEKEAKNRDDVNKTFQHKSETKNFFDKKEKAHSPGRGYKKAKKLSENSPKSNAKKKAKSRYCKSVEQNKKYKSKLLNLDGSNRKSFEVSSRLYSGSQSTKKQPTYDIGNCYPVTKSCKYITGYRPPSRYNQHLVNTFHNLVADFEKFQRNSMKKSYNRSQSMKAMEKFQSKSTRNSENKLENAGNDNNDNNSIDEALKLKPIRSSVGIDQN